MDCLNWMSQLTYPWQLIPAVWEAWGYKMRTRHQLYTVFICMYTFSPQQLSQDSLIQSHTHSTCPRIRQSGIANLRRLRPTVNHLTTPRRPVAAVALTMTTLVHCINRKYSAAVETWVMSDQLTSLRLASLTSMRLLLDEPLQMLYRQQSVTCDDTALLTWPVTWVDHVNLERPSVHRSGQSCSPATTRIYAIWPLHTTSPVPPVSIIAAAATAHSVLHHRVANVTLASISIRLKSSRHIATKIQKDKMNKVWWKSVSV